MVVVADTALAARDAEEDRPVRLVPVLALGGGRTHAGREPRPLAFGDRLEPGRRILRGRRRLRARRDLDHGRRRLAGADGHHEKAGHGDDHCEEGDDDREALRGEGSVRPGRVERLEEVEAVQVPVARVRRERPLDDPGEPDGEVGTRGRDGLVLRRLDERHERHEARGREGGFPRRALVEDRADREDVGRGVHVLRIAHLLGGHVARGPLHVARDRERDALARPGRVVARPVLGEAEVGDQGAPLGREEDVLRLEVAVDDPLRVGRAERPREEPAEREHLLDRHGPGDLLAERPAAQVRHDVVETVRRLARVEERDEPLLLA